jgi:hypothetical protein
MLVPQRESFLLFSRSSIARKRGRKESGRESSERHYISWGSGKVKQWKMDSVICREKKVSKIFI